MQAENYVAKNQALIILSRDFPSAMYVNCVFVQKLNSLPFNISF